MAVRSGTKEELFSQPIRQEEPEEPWPWFDYGVDSPPKWQLVAHLIFAIGAIGFGYLFWGWGGAFGGYLLEKVVSTMIWRPYRGPLRTIFAEEE